MNNKVLPPAVQTPAPHQKWGLPQRKCVCGQYTSGGECDSCRKKKAEPMQRSLGSAVSSNAGGADTVADALRSPGRPLDRQTRTFFETRFNHDFSRVRLHADSAARRSAGALNASAYTVGNDIVLQNRLPSSRSASLGLLAHELTHVIQQRNSASWTAADLAIDPSTSAERHAEDNEREIRAGGYARPITSSVLGLQRKAKERAADKSKATFLFSVKVTTELDADQLLLVS